jgi:hypothetical protein
MSEAAGVTERPGRDFWVFHREGAEWIAVWRTMFDLDEADA